MPWVFPRSVLSILFCCSLLGWLLLGAATAQNAPQQLPPQQPSQQQPQRPLPPTSPAEVQLGVQGTPPLPQPSLWLEAGLAYAASTAPAGLEPRLRFGVRGVQPLTGTSAVYAAFSLREGLLLDMGGWFSFLPGPDDLFGFRSFIGTGVSFAEGSFGVALSAAVSYELAADTALVLVYTHRPLLLPELGQAFDVSVGVQLSTPPTRTR